ncbi:hypothetical protein [Hydrogenophaga sp. IBVHS1]|uniref:hypothetical protein n=1 Tax=unclassified Hydrogenophaga TaxID=2610897 RepID=UPI0015C51427|nr:hypothetical protein [Hydrogenophaga sp. IBVHS1]
MRLPQDSAAQRLLLLLLLELELDELLLLLLLLDERLLGWLGATPTARAARFTPFSHPRKNPCTAESARPPLALLFELRLLDEFELLLLEEFDDELLEELFEELFEEFEDELLEELLDEFDEELEEEFEDEFPDELELLFELLLPALNLSGDTLFSTSCAASVSARADPRLWA